MFITGPDVIKTVTGEEVTLEELGGALTHASKSGVAHFAAADEDELPRGRALPALVPPAEQRGRPPPSSRRPTRRRPRGRRSRHARPGRADEAVRRARRDRARRGRRRLPRGAGSSAPNIVVGFARLDGHPVGIVANQPHLAGTLDIDASRQGRALRPDLRRLQRPAPHLRRRPRLPPRDARRSTAGSSATAPSCSTPTAEATVPRLTVIIRKA